jgi:hypothetical protein
MKMLGDTYDKKFQLPPYKIEAHRALIMPDKLIKAAN